MTKNPARQTQRAIQTDLKTNGITMHKTDFPEHFIPEQSGWHTPFSVAPPGQATSGAIATLSRNPGHADVYWLGPDGSVRTNFWTP